MSREVYERFMIGYVRRINQATFNVPLGGVTVGPAGNSLLASIDLRSNIITFSPHVIENVPERGRRYLVIHQLAHILEQGHGAKFWELVEMYEPNYIQLARALELAFKRNMQEAILSGNRLQFPNPLSGRVESPKLLLSPRLGDLSTRLPEHQTGEVLLNFCPVQDPDHHFVCHQAAPEPVRQDREPAAAAIAKPAITPVSFN